MAGRISLPLAATAAAFDGHVENSPFPASQFSPLSSLAVGNSVFANPSTAPSTAESAAQKISADAHAAAAAAAAALASATRQGCGPARASRLVWETAEAGMTPKQKRGAKRVREKLQTRANNKFKQSEATLDKALAAFNFAEKTKLPQVPETMSPREQRAMRLRQKKIMEEHINVQHVLNSFKSLDPCDIDNPDKIAEAAQKRAEEQRQHEDGARNEYLHSIAHVPGKISKKARRRQRLRQKRAEALALEALNVGNFEAPMEGIVQGTTMDKTAEGTGMEGVESSTAPAPGPTKIPKSARKNEILRQELLAAREARALEARAMEAELEAMNLAKFDRAMSAALNDAMDGTM
ncbi:hypothetical protein B0H63DRAFT_1471 [Podospora didyma]|uniref:Uncharacterized protein n=1 Tax=Podospora didyma TaxID=330526 RepID=A0AAE0P3Q9_9PEZI|nr:hypothetical protein B0H63DRAFT_1471 [Podospora didyma]